MRVHGCSAISTRTRVIWRCVSSTRRHSARPKLFDLGAGVLARRLVDEALQGFTGHDAVGAAVEERGREVSFEPEETVRSRGSWRSPRRTIRSIRRRDSPWLLAPIRGIRELTTSLCVPATHLGGSRGRPSVATAGYNRRSDDRCEAVPDQRTRAGRRLPVSSSEAHAAVEGVHGYVRNLPDGRVEALVEGDDEVGARVGAGAPARPARRASRRSSSRQPAVGRATGFSRQVEASRALRSA